MIWGLDPSTTSLGWAVMTELDNHLKLVDSGILKVDGDFGAIVRVLLMSRRLQDLLEQYPPQMAGIEQPFINGSLAHSALVLTSGFWMCAHMLVFKGCIDIYGLNPATVKRIAGSGRFSKEEMVDQAVRLFPDNLAGQKLANDEADAIHVARAAWMITSGREKLSTKGMFAIKPKDIEFMHYERLAKGENP